jgi:SanA protein
LTKRKKRIIVSAGILIAAIAASPFVINYHVKSSVADRILSVQQASTLGADCILVFGAGLNSDNSPSAMLADRLLRGIELYNSGASDRLLMSGDHGKSEYDEVSAMKQFAIEREVPSETIFMDHAGFSTYESLYRAGEIFKVKKVILVTQEYHLYRALYIARSFGMDAYGVSSDLQSYSRQPYYEAREFLARVKDFSLSILKPKPTFLGEAIPVTGDGNVTNDDSISHDK